MRPKDGGWHGRREQRTGAADLVGRDDEVAAVVQFLDSAARDGAALMITGEPGMGKTAMLDVALDRAAAEFDARILRAYGAEFEAELSYAGLHQLLLPVSPELADLPEPNRAALQIALGMDDGPAPDRLLLTTAVLTLLQRLARSAFVLVVVDDLQWLDRASAGVLGLVARRLAGFRIGLLLTQRSGDESFFDRTAITELTLAPLDAESARDLVHSLHPRLHQSVRERIVEQGGGNPLALIELPRTLTSEQESGADFLPTTLPLTDRLRRLFTARVSSLPTPTRRLLLLAALDRGAGAALMDVIAASDPDLAPAEASGLVTVDRRGRRVLFGHPLVRAAVVDLASPPQRRAAHRRLAQLTTQPEARALHLAEAALGPDDTIAEDLVRVADIALARGDSVQSISLLLRAADLTARPIERARRLTEAAYIGAHVTGALAGAGVLLARARGEHPGVSDTLGTAAAAATQLLNSDGDIDTAHRLLVGALDSTPIDRANPRSAEAVLETLMTVCSFGGRAQLWTVFDDAVARFAPLLSRELRIQAVTFADPVRSTPADLRSLDAMVADLDEEANPLRIVDLARAGWYVGRVPRDALQRVVAAGHSGETIALAANALVMLGVDSFFGGRWDETRAYADEAISLCEDNGYALLLWGALLPRMLLAAARADMSYLAVAHGRMRQWALPRNALAVRTFTAYVDGLAALSQARYGDALDAYSAVSEPGTFPPHEQVTPWMVMDLVEAAVRSGASDSARAHVRAAADAGIPELSPHSRFLYRAATALACDDNAFPDPYEALLTDPSSARWPFALARVELAYGERLRRGRALRAARPHLESARERFTALAATPWAERAEMMLRATGPTRRGAIDGRGAELTPQELQIARLAASGLSNRQIGDQLFLSPRTVGTHLYRVFPKLGISSRAALRDALVALGQ
ncbi:helix-turn-helix transcriptional regulator [Nocardia arizonensis]|uniref:helix-turn-helix transcriptional regulator n=1 Tax=Nocardia arizonensis TaxID=1141647 RepID=UPI0006CFA404|nr:LuxR family transcriptional regulator [Nocardia arizonensis]